MSADPSPPVPDGQRSGWAPVLLRLYPAAWQARYGDELADLIDERRLSLRDALDLLRGALDAHCNLADLLGEWSALTSRLRSAAVTTFTAWALFCIAVAGLVKATEDRAFVSAAQGHVALGVSYVVVQGAFILAGLAVLIGGLPAALVALRQAWQGRDAVLARLMLVPGLAAAVVVAYARLAVRLVPTAAGVHSVPRVALFAGLVVLGGAGTVGTVAAVRAATYRVELPIGLLRWAGWAGLVAAGAISSGVAALATFGWTLRTEEPALFGSANGLLAGPDRVGRAAFDWTDHSRADPYAPSGPAGFAPRELSVLVWYPALPAPSGIATSYQPPGWDQALDEGGISALARTPPSRVRSHAMADAPVAGGAPHPVLVFAPGLGLQAADYTTLAEDLASHGYVVAGINPTYSKH